MINILQKYTLRAGLLSLRIFKRLTILAVGIVLGYAVAWQVFPAFNQRVSLALAVVFTYAVTAYILIPAGIRLLRLWYKSNEIPLYANTPDGFACDPINIALVGTKHQIATAFKKAGWHQADPKTIRNMLKVLASIFFRKPYPNAPFSKLYLFGRVQDIGFQKQVEGSYFHRHHLRLWACTSAGKEALHPNIGFWRKKITLKRKQKQLWVGAAIKDTGLGVIRYHGQLTHSVDSDIDAERDFVVGELENTGTPKDTHTVQAGEATTTNNRVLGNEMVSSGQLTVIEL